MNKHLAAILMMAFLSPGAFAGNVDPYSKEVTASFERMLNHEPAAAATSSIAGRDALQDAFAANLRSSAPAATQKSIADASAIDASGERSARDFHVGRAR